MVSKLRRLIADHADLHNNDLPPNYLFSVTDNQSSDDLSQLVVMLAGPHGTPYSAGLWRLQLRIPDDYPASPPKAAFKTRIWHPNVEESTGAVCVDTLKRDWESKLTLRDILVTISCLLIHPNPDSALNPMAGSLLQDDYNEFARQARLMTSIHAPIPFVMKQSVLQAKQRGEDPAMAARIENEQQPEESKQETKTTSLVMKKKNPAAPVQASSAEMAVDDCTENMDGDDDCKENDPSLSPEPPATLPPSSKRAGIGKRPLSVIPTTPVLDTDIMMLDSASDDENMSCDGMTASERNIAANPSNSSSPLSQNSLVFPEQNTRQQISSRPFHSFNNDSSSYAIYEDNGSEAVNLTMTNSRHRRPTFGKENMENALFATPKEIPAPARPSIESSTLDTGVFVKPLNPSSSLSSLSSSSSSSSINHHVNKMTAKKPFSPMKVTKPASHHINGSSAGAGVRKGVTGNKGKPRIGLRRL
ncbi:hypothetical protein UA08_04553 [Talaromyces atroroseus]|uniref:UBC core domain-containing protein n=1 Tax=Talaromyces atroroseus TaxID=1441469 RepID=A0A225AP65_TALAT|nr:hypothetical protein UA08_04553 [Talaromyces atroroseus]OKL60164.1 hypothetical protein UA08_04553 [Talaromyces atroroseus]